MVKTQAEHAILVNHIGYTISGIKKVIYQTTTQYFPETFSIINLQNEKVFEGVFGKGGPIDEWHTGSACVGIFSEFEEEGEFHIQVTVSGNIIKSVDFRIEKNLLQNSCIPLLLEGFISQHPENIYENKDSSIGFTGDRKDTMDVHGGWYDASGDTSKYLSHLSYTNFMNPQQTPFVVWSLLESLEKNRSIEQEKISHFEKEAAWGADFLVRMLDPKGYFYMTVFDGWSKDPGKREISAYKRKDGFRTEDYQAGFRQGGGMAIASLAKASRHNCNGEFSKSDYLDKAVKGYQHLIVKNHKYLDDGLENIIDDYCALVAAVELFHASENITYLDHARARSQKLINRISVDENYKGWWSADDGGTRSFYHASDAGLPLVSLCKYLEIESDEDLKNLVVQAIQKSVDFEIEITNETINPFGYPRQYVKSLIGTKVESSFFFPHDNESGYWWQGENARLGSMATAMLKALPYLRDDQKVSAIHFAANQVNWILGLNPFNVCMLDGLGYNNPEYLEPENVNYRGGVCNGITSGFENESDIAFMPLPYNNDPAQQWRWSEQWIPHAAWFMLALSSL